MINISYINENDFLLSLFMMIDTVFIDERSAYSSFFVFDLDYSYQFALFLVNRTNHSSNYRNSLPYEQYPPIERDFHSARSYSRDYELPSYQDRRNFKRTNSKYDNEIIPSKRLSRR